jgi:hypothetical protein
VVSGEYVSVRSGVVGSSGWVSHGVSAPQPPLRFGEVLAGLEPLYEGDLSGDFSAGVVFVRSPLTVDPLVAAVPNLYVRRDLLSGGAGSYVLVSGCPGCSVPLAPLTTSEQFNALQPLPFFAGASADFGRVLFEDRQDLTVQTQGMDTGLTKLYVFDRGVVRSAGVLPDGSAVHAFAGQGTSDEVARAYVPHVISADGSRIFFTANPQVCRGGGVCGDLYVRELDPSPASSVQLNVSERTDCADHSPCTGAPEPDPAGPQPAIYWDASVDGSRVFFVSREALTDDAPLCCTKKLYMYETDRPASDPHNVTLLTKPVVGGVPVTVFGVVGASADGRSVFFIAQGQVLAGAPTNRGVYRWHDGTVSFVGSFTGVLGFALNDGWSLAAKTARVSPDGRFLLVTMSAPGGTQQLYRYDADTPGRLPQCVSCPADGSPPSAGSTDNARANVGAAQTSSHLSHALSDDGAHVFFTTTQALVPEDVNGRNDAYEWAADGTLGCTEPSGCIRLLDSGSDPADSYFVDASASGDDAFVVTRARLTGWDTDQNYDLYDARVGGGLPDPPAPTPACTGEGCQGPITTPPPAITPATLTTHNTNQLDRQHRHHRRKPQHHKHACRRHRHLPSHSIRRRCVAPRRTAHLRTVSLHTVRTEDAHRS